MPACIASHIAELKDAMTCVYIYSVLIDIKSVFCSGTGLLPTQE